MRLALAGVLTSVLVIPTAASSAATATIVVSTTSDANNADASTVARLIESPGRDGISLREAIEATNNDPDTWTIRFARKLRGKSIVVRGELPPLTGGGVSIEGQGVTVRSTAREGKGLHEGQAASDSTGTVRSLMGP